MWAIIWEVLFVFVLILANGIFAMSEMAIVSARKARLQQLAAAGDARAQSALALANAPDRFLSTVQIGITLVGILAGAFGGATIAAQIAVRLALVPALAPYAESLALLFVVAIITFLSLVFGELVPKRLALNNPERIAALVARPMNLLSGAASPLVRLLAFSSAIVFKILRVKPPAEPPVTEEEIKVLIEQGRQAGVFEEAEQDLVESVFRLADRRVGALMTARPDIVWLDVNDSPEKTRQKIAASHYSRFPVCDRALDNVVGVVKAKQYLAGMLADSRASLKDFLTKPLYVPETGTALQILESFKQSHTHIALIVDEYGSLEGLVTTNDVLEAIVGDVISSAKQYEPLAVRREDGSWLIDGALPIDDFEAMFPLAKINRQKGAYQTLAGFILARLGRIPIASDVFEAGGLRFEIVDMDGKRIDKVLVQTAEK